MIVKSTRENDTDKIGNEEQVNNPGWIRYQCILLCARALVLLKAVAFRLSFAQAHTFANARLLPPPAPYEDGKHQDVTRKQQSGKPLRYKDIFGKEFPIDGPFEEEHARKFERFAQV